MFKYKIGMDCIDWQQLFQIYEEVGLVAGYGKKKDYDKIRKAFEQSFKVVTA
ncbi:hypothetical protein [Desulfosporosinus sp. FKA]|uniref:hypothetical protein n=1 Tax=Desulfosporosinus sp. FKA TaxID=1969834 RepID=UPI001A9A2F17|nr:hypothetical protein [Desulfosporosinus sp. FKA]